MRGFKSNISAIAVHPKKSILAIAGANGFIIFWDYIKKGDIDGNQFELLTSEPKSEAKGKGSKDDDKIFTVMEFTPDGSELLIG
jgi:WD40 repeat protein